MNENALILLHHIQHSKRAPLVFNFFFVFYWVLYKVEKYVIKHTNEWTATHSNFFLEIKAEISQNLNLSIITTPKWSLNWIEFKHR